ncbi:glycosyltransferase [Kitasatospora sp. NPDC048365]|uniref:glycosyltransferase n=1 Tax=Kitasatospora sp. NPDC048365 TaxID=3364050 RepID=UPI00371A7565
MVRVRILALATEWLPAHGGVSTFNRQLCRALAAEGAEVYCSLPAEPSAAELADAQRCGVHLVTPHLLRGATHLETLARPPRLPNGWVPDVVLGHGRVTGRPAHTLVHDHFKTTARFHIVHTHPSELEWFKTDRDDDPAERAEDRTREEWELLDSASRVIAVGPRLLRKLRPDFADGDRLLRIDPGFDDPDRQDGPALTRRPGPPRILVVGRLEDHHIKGVDVAARAVGHVLRSEALVDEPDLELLLRGSRPGDGAELRQRVGEWAGRLPLDKLDVSVRNYSTDSDWLRQERNTASLVLMPSRAEAFGMVGMEAIAAGIPLLASRNSGLGMLLKERWPEQTRRIVLPLHNDEDTDTRIWAGAIAQVLNDREAAYAEAETLRRTTGADCTWSAGARTLLDAVKELRAIHVGIPGGTAPCSFYRQSIVRIAGGGCEGRDDELAAMADFATSSDRAGSDGWWRWLAPAWSGKTTVMAQFALNPPPGVRVVAFFITARLAGQNDRAAFCQIVQRQLYALLGEEEPPVTEQTRDSQLLHALERAAAQCELKGERLVLVVDGLDEDRGVTTGPDAHSIAALIPAVLPHGARAIVAGRPHPPVPDDVPRNHPLHGDAIDHMLSSSPYAKAARVEAERDLERLLHDGGLGGDLVGLVAAAGGGLTAADLAHLCTADTTPRIVERALSGSTGRAFTTRPTTWHHLGAGSVYLLAHEEIQQAALALIAPGRFTDHLNRIHAWAEEHRAAGWPGNTPEYLLRGYPDLLHSTADLDRLTALACDPARHERLWQVSGADRAALDDIRAAFDVLLTTGSAPSEEQLGAAFRLAVQRDNLHRASGNTPAALMAVWARLGRVDRAIAMAHALPTAETRAARLTEAAQRLVSNGCSDPATRLLDEASGFLPAIHDADARARAQADLAGAFSSVGEHQRAAELVNGITRSAERDRALALVAPGLAVDGLHPQAIRAGRSISEVNSRIRVLAEVTGALADAGHDRRAIDLAQEVIELSLTLGNERHRLAALVHVAGALIRSTATDQAARLLDEAIRRARVVGIPHHSTFVGTLTRLGHLRAAVELANAVPESRRRSTAFAAIATALAEIGDHLEAIRLARTITDRYLRTEALTEIAGDLAAADQGTAALELVLTIADPDEQVRALARVAGAVARAGDHKQASELARTINDQGLKAEVYADLADALVTDGQGHRAERLAQEAVTLARGVTDPCREGIALMRIAEALLKAGCRQQTTGPIARAVELAGAVPDSVDRVVLRMRVASVLTRVGRHLQAFELVDAVPDPFFRTAAITDLTVVLARSGQHDRALELVGSLSTPDSQASALAGVVRELAKAGHHRRATELAHTIVGPENEAEALLAVVDALAKADRHRQAVDVARTLTDAYDRACGLTRIADALARADRRDAAAESAGSAVRAARTITDLSKRDAALGFIAPVLARFDRHRQAVDLAQDILSPELREVALINIAAALTETGRRRLATEIADTIGDPGMRVEATAHMSVALARVGDTQGSLELARTIGDPERQAGALAKVAKILGPHRPETPRILLEALALSHWRRSVKMLAKVVPDAVADAASLLA